jgi:endonuclease/exonuclease/phosphatase family metal-dependent hydrolase
VIRLLSLNIQAGARTDAWHHYLSRIHHQFRFADRDRTLTELADALRRFDVVAIQESDEGSARTAGRHLTQELAVRAGFPYWTHGTNRRLPYATTGNAILSRHPIEASFAFALPGSRGRGATAVELLTPVGLLTVVSVHLSLRSSARALQAGALRQHYAKRPHTLVVGDFNADTEAPELRSLSDAFLRAPGPERTYPRWAPTRRIDHVLHSADLQVLRDEAPDAVPGDHAPVAVRIQPPRYAA